MTALFAQLQNVPAEFGWNFVLTCVGLLVAAAQLAALRNFQRSQKREVSFTDEAVRRSEAELVKKAADARMDAITQQFHDLSKQLADLRGEVRQDIGRIHDRLDEVPGSVIATLRNTGAIK